MNTFTLLLHVIGLGVGATLVMDFGLWILKQLNIPTLNFALLGRWVGWIFRGKFTHQAIGRSPAIQYEYLLGWIAHYSVGIFFAFSFVLIVGDAWLLQPKFGLYCCLVSAQLRFHFSLCNPRWAQELLQPIPLNRCKIASKVCSITAFSAVVYISLHNCYRSSNGAFYYETHCNYLS